MKTYILHSETCTERDYLVQDILRRTPAVVFPAVMLPNGGEGCTTSHFRMYEQDSDDVLVFEDDCEILSDDFLDPLCHREQYDLVYIGVNSIRPTGSYGTHAMWISAHAKKCFLEHNGDKKRPIDHLWNEVEQQYKLRVWRPDPIDRYVQQKKGLRSLITGRLRS
jgi:hypothetical protein